MRIIAGSHRGRPLASPDDDAIRPTHDRVRQSVFDRLTSLWGDFEGLSFLDAFAGTGSIGLEALSRGFDRAVMMDRSHEAIQLIKRNAGSLGLTDRADIIRTDACHPPSAKMTCSVVYCDPPFDHPDYTAQAVQRLDQAGWMAENVTIVCERDRRVNFVDLAGFSLVRDDSYGRIAVTIWQRTANNTGK